jgi:hypothetical protein
MQIYSLSGSEYICWMMRDFSKQEEDTVTCLTYLRVLQPTWALPVDADGTFIAETDPRCQASVRVR